MSAEVEGGDAYEPSNRLQWQNEEANASAEVKPFAWKNDRMDQTFRWQK
jgi:hypothetical protein